MGRDAETPELNGAILTRPLSGRFNIERPHAPCLPLGSTPCDTAVASVSVSGESGEAPPALVEPKSFHDCLSAFHAFRWLGVVTFTRRASCWSRGLSNSSSLAISSLAEGGVTFFMEGDSGCVTSEARRATVAGSDAGRSICRDRGKVVPPLARG